MLPRSEVPVLDFHSEQKQAPGGLRSDEDGTTVTERLVSRGHGVWFHSQGPVLATYIVPAAGSAPRVGGSSASLDQPSRPVWGIVLRGEPEPDSASS